MTTQLQEAVARVSESTPDAEVRVLRRIEVGQVIHQGDVYVHRIADDAPRGKEMGTRQVAVGDTQGSRHVAEGDVSVFEGDALPEWFEAPGWLGGAPPESIFLGPVVVAESAWTLTHPEHAHHRLPAGVYQVTYQADARARARMAD